MLADRLLMSGPTCCWPASPTGWRPPRCRSCVATSSASRCSSRGSHRIAAGANPFGSTGEHDPYELAGNAQAFLRALHLQLTLAGNPPRVRPDLILVLVEALKATNFPFLLAARRVAA